MGNTVKTIILLIMELALGTAFGFQGYRVCQSHELLINSIWFVQCAWMLIMHLERIVLKKKWLVPLAYLHLGLYLAGLFHIISISDYNYYEPTRLTPVFECMFFCSIFMMPTLLLYVMVWNFMNLIKRNMAGGEKKRVSPIDSEMMRERLRRMEERMHGPVDQEAVAVDEAEVEPALAAETAPPAESQETGEEDVPEESIEESRVEYQWPTTEGRITSAFGSREDAVPNPHPGIDIAPMIPGQKGQDILSAENGTVIIVGMSAGGSSEIHIEHTNGEVSIYKHHDVQSVQVKVGDGVYKGEKIAEMSDVGSPEAVHLHFEIRPSAGLRQKDAIDPVPKLPDIPATIHLTEAVERSGNTLKNK